MDTDYELKTRVTGLDELKVQDGGRGLPGRHLCAVQTELGRRYVLEPLSSSIGRGRDNDIVLPSDCVSRQHVRLEHRADGLYLVDLDSTNGTFVNDDPSGQEHRLRRGDQSQVGDTIFKFLSRSDVEVAVPRDHFPHDGHRRAHGSREPQAARHAAERRDSARAASWRDLSVLMLDIDHFKSINDTLRSSRPATRCCAALPSILQKRLRPNDKLGRYGGEEFCAILPETDLHSAAQIGEELRVLRSARLSSPKRGDPRDDFRRRRR